MIDTRAISAITTALRLRLEQGLNQAIPGTQVVTRPPDKMRAVQGHQLNLFLFHCEPHAAWRNAALTSSPGEGADSPSVLALKLQYLLSVYGADDDAGPGCQWLLAEAMRLCEQSPVLERAQLTDALPDVPFALPARRVEIAPYSLSVDEMARLWGMFQSPYRLSVAYEVSVVLAAGSASDSR
jgi:hypothetical protein